MANIKIVERPNPAVSPLFNEIAPVTSGTDTTLDTQDSEFQGIKFTVNDQDTNATDSIAILEAKSTDAWDWVIPEDSKLRFVNSEHSRVISIDDGDLD